ncbi:YadA-like family protein [Paraburkholderia fungorum]|uniref:YadA-like family protein n=1 Tax=Paraburkholderia fungorum TaxID=134537 RepID=UPI0038B6D7A5
MNKSYKTVWNETTGTYVAAPEVAKSRGKKSRNTKALVAALMAAGVGFGTAVKAETVDNLSQANNSTCVSSEDGTQDTPNSGDCTKASQNTAASNDQASTGGTTSSGQRGLLGATLPGVSPTSYIAMGDLNHTLSAVTGTYQDDAALNTGTTTTGSIAIGGGALTTGIGGTAIGTQARAATQSTALGSNAISAPNAVSVGNSAGYFGSGNSSVSLGFKAAGSGDEATALGAFAPASAANSVALGGDSTADRANTVSVGAVGSERQIVNVAAATQATDAANFGQLTGAAQSIATALGGGASVDASGRVTTPTYTIGGTSYSDVGSALGGLQTAINNISGTSKWISVLNGTGNAASTPAGTLALAVGPNSYASGNFANAIGSGATASTNSSTAVGASATASGANATALGYSALGSGGNAAALGFLATAAGASSTAIGNRANVGSSGVNSTALGYGASVNVSNSVALGTNSVATRANTVSVGAVGSERQVVNVAAGTQATDAVNYAQLQAAGLKTDTSGNATNSFVAYDDTTKSNATLGGASGTTLTNVAAGAVSASSTDAVNGSQLYATNQNVVQNTAAIAQNTSDISTNASNIAQNASDITQHTSAIGTLNTQVGTINGEMADVVKYDTSAHDTVTLSGPAGTKLTNVAAGAVSASSMDAVNGSQLYATNQSVAQNTSDISTINSQVASLGSGVADAVAYDTSAHDKVTLGGASGTTLTNVAAGVLSSSSKDAVNGTQLYTTNQNVATNAAAIAQNTSDISTNAGNIAQNTSDIAENTTDIGTLNTQVGTINGQMADVAKYDSPAHDTMTLAGIAGTKITNVAAGELSASSSDAVNGSQLYATNQSVAQNTAAISQNSSDIVTINSQIASLGGGVAGAVVYDSAARDKVTFAGASGTTLTNVAAGAVSGSSMDAVNGSQLYATNQNVATNAAAIAQNTSDISTNTGNIAQNTSDIAKNAGDIANLDTRVTTVEGSVSDLANQINTGAVGLVQQDPASGDLTVAANTGGTRVNFMGTTGPRELLGVAAGTTSNSAVNLGQLNPLVASLGGGAQVNADGSIVSPTYHMQGGTQSTVGDALDTLDTNLSSLETQINNGSIGMVTQDSTSRDLRIGATTDGTRLSVTGTAGNRVVTGVAAGAVSAESVDAVNGSQLHANAASTAAALGGGSTVNADGTVSAPSYSVGGTTVNNVGAAIANVDGRVTQNTSDIASLQTTVGSMSGSVANAVSYDTSAHNQVTLGGSTSAPKVKLTNLQDGELSATSTDAVTGAQLWNTNQQLSDLSQSVQNQQQTGSAAMSLNAGGAPAAAATGNNALAVGGGSQASGDNSVAIGSGSVADEANTVSVGSQGNERRITNVADGKAATDAVNMRQFQSGINDVARSAYSGVAAATALTMIPEVDPGKTLAVGVAGATYKGYQAAAVGASARITQNLKVKVGAGISGSETTVGAGASYQW